MVLSKKGQISRTPILPVTHVLVWNTNKAYIRPCTNIELKFALLHMTAAYAKKIKK